MGKPRLSHQQKIARLVARKAEGCSPGCVTRSKLRVILHACGWKKRGSENLARIQAAFEEAGIYPERIRDFPVRWFLYRAEVKLYKRGQTS